MRNSVIRYVVSAVVIVLLLSTVTSFRSEVVEAQTTAAGTCEIRSRINGTLQPWRTVDAAKYPEFCTETAPTATATNTSVPPTTTATNTPVVTRTNTPVPGSWYVPPANVTWNWQLTGTVNISDRYQLYGIDGFDNTAATVQEIHNQGSRAVCYISAGSWENWRPDASQFPTSVRGRNLDGWPGEKFLDIRQPIVRQLMLARMDMCKAKGFDAVEPDNIDTYQANNGFNLTAQDQINYNIWLAQTAHSKGLGIALKNDLDQIPQLVQHFDFIINEQCNQYNECAALNPFRDAGKAVLIAEYERTAAQVCTSNNSAGYRTLIKRLDLDYWHQTCWTR
jgi:hypothetical protein